MNFDLQTILRMVGETMRDPGGVAKELTRTRYDRPTLWMGLALVTVLSVLLTAVANLFAPVQSIDGQTILSPMTFGIIVGSSLVMLVFAIYWVGRMFGGTGHFPETLLLVIWLQVVAIALQVVQIVTLIILPGLMGIVSIAVAAILLWCLAHFINILHGFGSLLKATMTFIVAVFGIAFGLALILTLIGVSVQAGGL